MKKITIFFLAIFVCFSAIGQTSKNVIIIKSPKTVPTGKKWILEAGQTTRVQVSYGVLNSGSLCNALFLSSPRMVSNVNRGNISNTESYMLIFNNLEKVQYTNEYTYDLTIISIADKDFSVYDLQDNKPEDIGMKRIEFKAGERVFVGNCLESIELKEINMTQAELLEIKKKEDAVNKVNQQKLANFQIPINPEKYVEPGTKLEIHDSMLKSIVFSSPAVLHKQPGKGYAFDDVSTWVLSLTADEVILSSSNGIDKTYTVIKIEYDEQMRMQKFVLGNSDNEITHYILIAWSNSRNQYSLLLSSTDKTEEYQFQEVQSSDKVFQTK